MQEAPKQYRKIIQLTFPPENVAQPVMCQLVRKFDVTYNIVAAQTTPGKEGYMTLEIWGEDGKCRNALQYLRELGIDVAPARQRVTRDENSCMHCGLCTAMCPASALRVDRLSLLVLFDPDKCTACGVCTRVCPIRAMQGENA